MFKSLSLRNPPILPAIDKNATPKQMTKHSSQHPPFCFWGRGFLGVTFFFFFLILGYPSSVSSKANCSSFGGTTNVFSEKHCKITAKNAHQWWNFFFHHLIQEILPVCHGSWRQEIYCCPWSSLQALSAAVMALWASSSFFLPSRKKINLAVPLFTLIQHLQF